MTKRTRKLLTPKSLRDIYCRLHTLKNFLSIYEAPPALERSFKAVTKLELSTAAETENISIIKLLPLTGDLHVRTLESSQNTDLNRWIFRNL